MTEANANETKCEGCGDEHKDGDIIDRMSEALEQAFKRTGYAALTKEQVTLDQLILAGTVAASVLLIDQFIMTREDSNPATATAQEFLDFAALMFESALKDGLIERHVAMKKASDQTASALGMLRDVLRNTQPVAAVPPVEA